MLWQGLRDKTLGGRGSLWCCYGKALCSLLLPLMEKMASMKDKVKTRESNERECFYNKALSANLRRKTTLSVDNLGLGRLLLLEIKQVWLAKGKRRKECTYD